MRESIRSITAALVLAAIGAVAGFAQTANTPFTAPQYYATSFQLWSINQQSPNTYIFQGRNLCNSQGQNMPFFVFNTNAPVLIADSNSSNSEVVTPSAIVNTAGSCGATVAPSHNHYTFQMKSGTAGLQEAINTLDGQGAWPAVVVLDKNWWTIANQVPGTYATAIIAAAKGDDSVLLEDITTAPYPTFYVWSGSTYTSTNANWQNTAPTIARGAALGAGSASATIGNGSTALAGYVTVVTNSGSTTTGTMFTMTYPAVSAGGPQYTLTCKMNSVTYPTTYTQTWSSSGSTTTYAAVNTIAATTTAPVASSTYVFTYNCK